MGLNALPKPCSRAWLDYNMLVLPLPTICLIGGVFCLLLGSLVIIKVQYSDLMANIYWGICGIALIIISVIIRFIATGSKLAARRQYVAEVIDMDVAASPMHSTTSRSIKKAFCGVCGNTKSSSPDTKFCEFCGKEFK
jgi:hypothetical protein